jgi:hypothetical protein
VAIVDGNNNVLTQGALDASAGRPEIAPEKYKVAREGGGTPALISKPPDESIADWHCLIRNQDIVSSTPNAS